MKLGRIVKVLSVACSLFLVTCVQALSGTRAEWQEVLARIDALQANPLAPDAKEQGAWILKWLVESKDVSVTLCADLTVSLTQKDDDVGGVLAVHSLLGAAKYALTVPTAQQSKVKMYEASMNAVLDAYGKMVATDEKFRRKKVDEAVDARTAGQLEEYVRKHGKKCDH